jgi:hypothetical protein
MLRQIPHSSLMQRPKLTGSSEADHTAQRPYFFACSFYGITQISTAMKSQAFYTVPFTSVFENLISLSRICANVLIRGSPDILILREVYSHSLLLIDRLVGRLGTSVEIAWDPSEWLQLVLHPLEHEVNNTLDFWSLACLLTPNQSANFTIVDRTVSLVVALHQTNGLEPRMSIDNRPIMYKMVNKLMKYLRSDCAVYHVRAVNLIWSLEAATKRSHVESILAQTMTSPESRNVYESYEAFGILWRLTGWYCMFCQPNPQC